MGMTNQRGYVTPRGKQWYGYYRRVVADAATGEHKSVRVPVILGPKSGMTKTEARRANSEAHCVGRRGRRYWHPRYVEPHRTLEDVQRGTANDARCAMRRL